MLFPSSDVDGDLVVNSPVWASAKIFGTAELEDDNFALVSPVVTSVMNRGYSAPPRLGLLPPPPLTRPQGRIVSSPPHWVRTVLSPNRGINRANDQRRHDGESRLRDNTRVTLSKTPTLARSTVDFTLHRLCQRQPACQTVEKLLQADPEAIGRRLPTSGRDGPCYSLPLNIALHHGAQVSVIEALAFAAPKQLADPDGERLETSLHVAIRRQCSSEVIDMLLLTCPSASTVKDRYGNTPLHVACQTRPNQYGVIRHVFLVGEEALSLVNAEGKSPLDLLKSNERPICPKALNYLEQNQNL